MNANDKLRKAASELRAAVRLARAAQNSRATKAAAAKRQAVGLAVHDALKAALRVA